MNLRQDSRQPGRSAPAPPRWVLDLTDSESATWRQAGSGLWARTSSDDHHTFTSVICRDVLGLEAEDFARRTVEAYRLLGAQLEGRRAENLVRVWNFIPGILSAVGDLPHRYMSFNVGRYSAYDEWFRGHGGFDRELATASGVGHRGADLVIHGLASSSPGVPVENPRQIPAYRYSLRYGPLPPCFARATRAELASMRRPWLLVGGTASVRGEDTMHAGDLDAQCRETTKNLASVASAALTREGVDDAATWESRELMERYRHLRIYYVLEQHEQRLVSWAKEHFAHADVELVRADLCRDGLLIEIEGVAELGPAFPKGLRN